jgi:hypothetical protein
MVPDGYGYIAARDLSPWRARCEELCMERLGSHNNTGNLNASGDIEGQLAHGRSDFAVERPLGILHVICQKMTFVCREKRKLGSLEYHDK